tara:strand:+ start:370 stop:630 length:261 start_codon:yes stop_codon:yes gene_type:complete
MNIPEELFEMASAALGMEYEASVESVIANQRRGRWAVVYGLVPKKDGNMWYVLLGQNLQVGIAGFGETPEKAIDAFEDAMKAKITL